MTIKEMVACIKKCAVVQGTSDIDKIDFIIWMGVKGYHLSLDEVFLLNRIDDCEIVQIAKQGIKEAKA